VFAASALGAPFVQYKRAAYEHPDEAAAAFTLDLVAKDLALVAGLATEVGAAMEQLAANRRVVAAALAAGFGSADMSALATHLRGSR
jgi:3-hydroxyisobutyrate dehydrogenase/2-hydroxy-3-oxopropionate reductase